MSVTLERPSGSDTCVVHMRGDVDIASVPEIKSVVDPAIASGCTRVVLDFAGVEYADSSALGLIVWLDRRLSPLGGRVVIAGAGRDVSRVLELSGLVSAASSLSTATDVDDALVGLTVTPVHEELLWERTLSTPARPKGMSRMRSRVCELVKPLGLSDASLFDLKVAVGEALANAVRHGSPSAEDKVTVVVSAYGDRVVVSVCDRGCGYDGEIPASDDVFASGGRGILFMRSLSDGVEFSRSDVGGTVVSLTKHVLSTPETADTGDRS